MKSATPSLVDKKIQNSFTYIDRGCRNSIVLVPGWATDYRIFSSLNLDFNYLLVLNFSPLSFEKNFLRRIKDRKIRKVSLLGWSLGGFVAAEFASRHINLIDELILVSIRKKYKKTQIVQIKNLVKKNKRAYLYKFYTQCFPDQKQMSRLGQELLKDYCERFDLEYLLSTLHYLENTQIKPELLNDIKKIKIIHGEYDYIAPIQEAIDISNNLSQAKFISIKDAGHIPFLSDNFSLWIRKS